MSDTEAEKTANGLKTRDCKQSKGTRKSRNNNSP